MGNNKDEWSKEDFINEYANITRDELVKIVAHDIRNQLATIVGYLELMNYDAKNARLSEADKQQFIQIMIARAHTIETLLEASVVVDKNLRDQ